MTLHVALRHRFPGIAIDMDFTVPTPGVTALFGPSGAGKSTVIAAVAGLLRPDRGLIRLDGQTLADTEQGLWLPPERRRIGLVFQDARLFPHMSVATNLRYGLRRAGRDDPSRAARAGDIRLDDVVALLGIGTLLPRRPRTLSGGERQRVAIGRALLAQPRLLLMDEPLASLDEARKAEILPYLARLKTALRLPVLYVTHAMDEVARLADHLVLIEAGRVAAAGPLAELATQGGLALNLRDDAGAVLDMEVAAHDPARRLTRLQGGGLAIWVPLLDRPVGGALRLRIPAREVILALAAPEAVSVQNIVSGTVRAITGDAAALVEVTVGTVALLARVTPDAVQRLGLRPGLPVVAMFKSVGVDLFTGEDGRG